MAKKSSKQKRYFWLKLKEDWFSGTTEKYLKSLPAGDSLLITYLKIQLMSLKTEGFLKYERLLPSAEEEIAMLIDEPVNNVRLLINVLLKTGAIERLDDNSLYLLSLQNLIGSEGSSTDRVRRFRERQKALQCNNNQLQIEGEILGNSELDVENSKALQCNDNVMQDVTDENLKILQNLDLKTQRYNVTPMKRNGNGEKELDLEKEQEPNGTTLDYTTLNIIFNYINKYELKKQLDLSLTEEEQKEHARMFLVINTLKKLELYMTDKKTFEIMTEERQKDLLIQYYVIDEFSKSPYNFLLYKLNTENFNFRYKKAMKYVDKSDLERFVSYLIACLQEELID
jgi:predicted phage replisome organizer